MKKLAATIALAAVVSAGVFALPEVKVSAGAGGYFTGDFGGGIEVSGSGGGMTMKQTIEMPSYGGGGFVFVDATYAEVSLGFFGGGGTVKSTTEITGFPTDSNESDYSGMGLDIGLMGKFPFVLNEKLTVFPLAGIAYRVMLSAEDEDGKTIKNMKNKDAAAEGDFNALWFKFGGGLDFSFTENVFLRGSVTYGIRLANKYEKDMVSALKDMYKAVNIDASGDPRLGHGLEVKVGVGYRF